MTFQGFPPGIKDPYSRPVLPWLRQTKIVTGNGSFSFTLDQAPLPGSVLVVGATTQQASFGPYSGSGGGAFWSAARWDEWNQGSQATADILIGKVGSNPSTSVSVGGVTNAGVAICAEFVNLAGALVAAGGLGATHLTTMSVSISAPPVGIVVWMVGNRTSLVSPTPWERESAQVLMNQTNLSNGIFAWKLHRGGYPSGTITSSTGDLTMAMAVIR